MNSYQPSRRNDLLCALALFVLLPATVSVPVLAYRAATARAEQRRETAEAAIRYRLNQSPAYQAARQQKDQAEAELDRAQARYKSASREEWAARAMVETNQ